MEKTDLKTQLAEVAERIRTMREIMGLSEEEMARCTGVPKEEYQACEAGEKDFSFTFIYKCAQRFGIDPTDLIKGVSPTLSSYTVNRKGDGLPITRRQGFKYLNMAPLFKNKTAEPFFVTMPYEEAQQHVAIKLSTHAGQELDIILKGAMKVQVGSHIEVLHEGDSIYYNSATPHGMIAVEGEPCQFYAIVMKGSEEFAPEQDRFDRLVQQHLVRQERETVSTPFVKTELDENGILKSIRFENEEKFNFAFDIVDKLAEKSPDKLAMLHVSRDKTERRFTFSDISRWSNKTANYLESLGIRRGDRVMVVLKRHYQFWFVITALHKMGAVIIPATNLLMEHDFDYRFQAAGVKAILCTADGQVADEADKAAQKLPLRGREDHGGGEPLGWHDFDKEVEPFPDTYQRKPDAPCGSDPCSCSSPPAPPAIPKSPSTAISTPWATTSPPNTGTTSTPRASTSPSPTPAGARRCGASTTASGCVRPPSSPTTSTSSTPTTSCPCSRSTTSPPSARLPPCTASSSRRI